MEILHMPTAKKSRAEYLKGWRQRDKAKKAGFTNGEVPLDTGTLETVSPPETPPETVETLPETGAIGAEFAGLEVYAEQARAAGVSLSQLFHIYEQFDNLCRVDFLTGLEKLCELYGHPKEQIASLLLVRNRVYDGKQLANALGHDPIPETTAEPPQAPQAPAPAPPAPIQAPAPPQPAPAPLEAPAPISPQLITDPRMEADIIELRRDLDMMRNRYANVRAISKSQAAAKHVISTRRSDDPTPRRDNGAPNESWADTVDRAYKEAKART